MKKILSFALLGLALSGNAQNYQIPNSDFSNWATDDEPGNGWYSFKSAGGGLSGIGAGVSPAPSKDTDRLNSPNSFSCKIYSKSALGKKANGNLTTGKINMGSTTPANAKNYNYTDRSGSSSNCLLFAGRPDAVEFWAKFKSGGSPNGRGQFIIHDDVDYRDPEITSQAGNRVGKASVLIPASSDWTHYTGEFTYYNERTSKQYMLASFTTNPTPGGSADDYLWIDDVNLIYYHSISNVKYGKTALNFTKTSAESAAYEVYRCDMLTTTYDTTQTITYTLKGVAATVNKSYDEQTGLLTITVKGDDYAVNSNSQTVYKVQFHAPHYTGLLSGLKVNGNVISPFKEDSLFYTVVGDYTEGCIEATTKGADDKAFVMYDETSRIASVRVSGGDNPYYVKFARKATEYTGKMIIEMDGMFLSASNSPVGISTPIDGKVDFQLLNFSLEDLGPIGDIFVTDVAYGEPENGVVNFSKEQTIKIFGAVGEALGELPVTLTGKVENGEMTARINITWNADGTDLPIVVNVYPFSTSSIDLQNAAGAGEYISAVKEGLTNKNALIYVAEDETVSAENADNVVVGSTCDNFTLTEGQAFDAPKAFNAKKVTYDRTLSAGNVQTFVLPFSITPGENDVVAALESVSVEGSVLTFKRIEGATEANKPYLIQTANANALASFKNVNIEPTTGDLTTTVKGVSHIGSYAEHTVTNAYGYADGQFVQAGRGTVKPFRTYITIPAGSAAAPKAFDIHFADTETGIATVVTDSKDQNVYNLQGVRVAHSLNGLPKGIYIVNGKKTVIK